MIEAKDLRIGNLVIYSDTQTLFEVTDINSTGSVGIGVKNKDEETWIELDQFEPVRLEPEVLEKCGFKEMQGEVRGKMKGIGVFVNGIYDFEQTLSDSGIYALSIHEEYTQTQIKYLHQLQNLYFALTGVELTINRQAQKDQSGVIGEEIDPAPNGEVL